MSIHARLGTLLLFLSSLWTANALAEEQGILEPIAVDITDRAALQRGAKYFVNYCMGCHSARYERYIQLTEPLGISEQQVRSNLIPGDAKIGSRMTAAMPSAQAQRWFGTAPPDLSDIAAIRGPDWLYAYLTGFYLDPERPFGVNNRVFDNVARRTLETPGPPKTCL
jgi:ubiquinol-cytochrome c reductase cytochrome c1 subunit